MKTLLFAVLSPLLTLSVAAQGIPEIKPLLVHAFNGGVPDFNNGVITGINSDYFGFSTRGGALDRGTLFRIDDMTGVVTIHKSFGDEAELRGEGPIGRPLFLNDGFFFGVTSGGGRFGCGTVFVINLLGEATTLVDFSGNEGAAPGIFPQTGLTEGPGDTLYGTTSGVVSSHSGFNFTHYGSLFRVTQDTGRFETLVRFTGKGGAFPGERPSGPVAVLPDGTIVGTTQRGGKFGRGTIFRIDPDGTFTSFPFTKLGGALPGAEPEGELFIDGNNTVYGIASLAAGETFDDPSGALWQLPVGPIGVPSIAMEFDEEFLSPSGPVGGVRFVAPNQATILFRFGSTDGDGGIYNLDITGTPTLSLRKSFSDTGGVIPFGVNFTSGAGNGAGAKLAFTATDQLFEVDMNNIASVRATTMPDGGTGEGARPIDPVVFDAGGELYQRTRSGGANGTGTIFKVPTSGSGSALASIPGDFFSFDSQPLAIDGSNILLPRRFGGANNDGEILQFDGSGILSTRATFLGTVAEGPTFGLTKDTITPSNVFFGQASFFDGTTTRQVIYRLDGNTISRVGIIPSANDFPTGPLTQLDTNHFLGVQGGSSSTGRVFRVGIGGNVTNFATFGGATGSRNPRGPLFREVGGTFVLPAFSTKSGGDPNIIRLGVTGGATKIGSIATGDSFAFKSPIAPLAGDAQGRVFGALIQSGGSTSNSVLYRRDTTGKVDIVYRFLPGDGPTDVGVDLSTGLVVGPDGAIYGSTTSGGANGGGAIFKIFPQPVAVATTDPAGPVMDGSTMLTGTLSNNGYNVEYWWSYNDGNGKGLNLETPHFFTGGFHAEEGSPQGFSTALTPLRGNQTYTVQFNARVGFGADAILVTGNTIMFTTPNGAPVAADDTILVTAEAGGFAGEVLDNDAEPDGDTLTVTAFTQGTYGSVAADPGNPNKLIYTPTPAFFDENQGNRRDSFTYTISDGQGMPLTSSATVTVLSDVIITGEYAGLLFDDSGTDGAPREAEFIPSPNQIAAGFAQLAIGKGRRFSGRFNVGNRAFSVKGALNSERGTRITADKGRFNGIVRTTPAGAEARITLNGRTLVLRAGQAFAAVSGPAQVASDFTMRFDPTDVSDPVSGPGLPAGSGYALVRQGKTARATLVGALPDGTKFSAKSVIDATGNLPFQALLSKGKNGMFEAELVVDLMSETVDPAVGTTARWSKPAQVKSKRFPGGFSTNLMPFGGKHNVPAKNTPVLDLEGGSLVATFDRGGVFDPVSTTFTFTGAKAVADAGDNTALATAKFNGVTGVVSGTFRPAGKPVKYVGVVIQRGTDSVAGYFLGTADAGSVTMAVTP